MLYEVITGVDQQQHCGKTFAGPYLECDCQRIFYFLHGFTQLDGSVEQGISTVSEHFREIILMVLRNVHKHKMREGFCLEGRTKGTGRFPRPAKVSGTPAGGKKRFSDSFPHPPPCREIPGNCISYRQEPRAARWRRPRNNFV